MDNDPSFQQLAPEVLGPAEVGLQDQCKSDSLVLKRLHWLVFAISLFKNHLLARERPQSYRNTGKQPMSSQFGGWKRKMLGII